MAIAAYYLFVLRVELDLLAGQVAPEPGVVLLALQQPSADIQLSSLAEDSSSVVS